MRVRSCLVAALCAIAAAAWGQSPISRSTRNYLLYNGASAGADRYAGIAAPTTLGVTYRMFLPTSAPSVGSFLGVSAVAGTDATLSWSTPLAGNGTATQVAFWATATSLSGNNNLWWDNTNGRLGIRTNAPTQRLDVAGRLLIDDAAPMTAGRLLMSNPAGTFTTSFAAGSQIGDIAYVLPTAQGASGTVLTNDGSGNLSWKQPGEATVWTLTGNSGTTAGTNFLGTTDAQGLSIRTSNSIRVSIPTSTKVGIGVTAPGATLSLLTADTATVTTTAMEILGHNSTSTPAAGFGSHLIFQGASATVSDRSIAQIGTRWLSATEGLQSSALTFSTTGTGTLSERMRIDSNGYIGLGTTTPNVHVDFTGSEATRGKMLVLSNGTNNNVALGNYSFVHIDTNTSAITITGIANGTDGKYLRMINNSGQALTIANQSSSSSAANRIVTGAGTDVVMNGSNQAIDMMYDGYNSVWRLGFLTGTELGAISSTQYYIKAHDDSSVNTLNTVNDPELQFSISANQTWEFHGELEFYCTQNASDMDFGLSAPTGATLQVYFEGIAASSNGGGTAQGTDLINSSGTMYYCGIQAPAQTLIRLRGIVTSGSSGGTVQLQWKLDKKNSAPTLYLRAGSYLSINRVL